MIKAVHALIYSDDPEAIAIEEAAPTHDDEFHRKVRIGTGAFQTLFGNPMFLNPLKGLPVFAYFSHKVLRWLAPLLLLAALACNAILARESALYEILLVAQAGFYLLAAHAWVRVRNGRSAGPSGIIFYFVSMNLALLLGMARFIFSPHTTVWSSTPRRVAPPLDTPKRVVRE